MTIQEAINHAKEVAERNRKQYINCPADRRDIEHQTCEMCAEEHEQLSEWLEELQQYQAIGTVEECQEARERQIGKKLIYNSDGGVDKDWICPACGKFCNPYFKYCQNCGQAII